MTGRRPQRAGVMMSTAMTHTCITTGCTAFITSAGGGRDGLGVVPLPKRPSRSDLNM